jgi:hypothetical protein
MKKSKSYSPNITTQGAKQFNGHAHWDAMYKTSEWTSYRAKFLKVNPECYSCGDPATVCDHLVPWKGDQKLFEKVDNHIPLCSKCHNFITSKFDRNHRPGSTIIPKLEWLSANRSINGVNTRVKVLPRYG